MEEPPKPTGGKVGGKSALKAYFMLPEDKDTTKAAKDTGQLAKLPTTSSVDTKNAAPTPTITTQQLANTSRGPALQTRHSVTAHHSAHLLGKPSHGVAAALTSVMNKHEKGPRAPNRTAADRINKDVLTKMRETFASADLDGTGNLTPDEFVSSFTGVLHTEDGSDEAALGKLFMRIDANSDGTVNWDEFCTYMLLESQGSASLRDLENSISFEPSDDWVPPEHSQHTKIITNISHVTLPNGSDRYVTCSKDGSVRIWNAKDVTHMRTLNVGSSWVTGARMLPTTKKLVVSSFARCMKIFDLQTYEQCGQIPELEYAVMAIDVWAPARHRDVEMVALGDGGGSVRLYELRVNPMEEKTSNDRYLDTMKWKHQNHSDWVTCVKYVEELNSVIAGSLDKTISMTDAGHIEMRLCARATRSTDDRVAVKMLEGHAKGVSAVDWSSAYKFIVSASQDRKLMMWNPFSLKPLATLLGHVSSVMAVVVNDRDNQIISVSADKHIKLWDIRNHKCIQTLVDRQEAFGTDEDALITAEYDMRRKQLLTGNLWPKAWKQTVTAAASCGHKEPVTRVLYNPLFQEAVSADQGGTVSVWYVPTGKLRFRFGKTHPNKQLTALNFDHARRRLLTGAEDGEVKVWNFSSGACLCVLKPYVQEEVTCILTIRSALLRHFLVAGWDRRITCYEDAGPQCKESRPGRVILGHKADILDMAIMEGTQQVVSVSDDGELCAWNVESGALRWRTTPPNHAQLPMNEQGIERVAFLPGKLGHIFVTVGADRWLRFWDCPSHNILAEAFTGHMMGETVLGLAVDPSGKHIATGDAAGIVKVWDISEFKGAPVRYQQLAQRVIVEAAVWRAHSKSVTSMDWVDAGRLGHFVLTSSADKTVCMWTHHGVFVGQFGAHVWLLDTPQSWKAQEVAPLQEKDQHDLEVAQMAPRRRQTIVTEDALEQPAVRSGMGSRAGGESEGGASGNRAAFLRTASIGSGHAPDGVARVLMASQADRLHRITSIRMRSVDTDNAGAAGRRSMRQSVLSQSGQPALPAALTRVEDVPQHVPVDKERSTIDEGGEDSEPVEESSASDRHSSDEDVPRALWLDDFNIARKHKHSASSGAAQQPAAAKTGSSARLPRGRRKPRVSIFSSAPGPGKESTLASGASSATASPRVKRG